MNSNVNIEYANAYSEVLEVLNNMSKEDYNKIPKDMLEMFKTNCNNEYQFRYDLNKKFEQQEISKRAKLILAILFRDYWATPYQKESIVKNEESNIGDSSNLPIELKKEKFYEKIINFFQKIFHNLMN